MSFESEARSSLLHRPFVERRSIHRWPSRLKAWILRPLLVLFGLSAAAMAQGGEVVIGSKNFTESRVLGELMRELIEAHTNLEVRHEVGLGGTLVCFAALESGQIDLYPEYTGTAWSAILTRSDAIGDSLATFMKVQDQLRRDHDVECLQPFGLNNTYALAVKEGLAQERSLRTVTDLVRVAADLRAGFSHEFLERQDGYAGLRPFYGLEFGEARGMEHALAYEALASGEIDVIDAYSTDGKLARYELRVLEDDRSFFPPYNATPLVNGATLRRHPQLRDAIERLAFQISDEEMMQLNFEAEAGIRDFDVIARDFLEGKGLVGAGAKSGVDEGSEARRLGLWRFLLDRWRETLALVLEHLQLTLISVLLAACFAIPLGIWITTHDLARRISLGLAGVLQTIPSLALLAIMIAVPGLGISARSAMLALFLYAILPILRNTYAGLSNVDPELIDAAKAIGLTRRQILLRVQLPLATRTIMAGVRTATVISIGVATLAAFIGAGGLGEPIVTGLYLNDARLVVSGALPAAILAVLADVLLSYCEGRLIPRGLRLSQSSK